MQKRQNKLKWNNYRIGLILTVAITFVILLGIFWTPYDPEMMQGSLKLKGPSLAHWFGTDQFGRDVLSRVVRGAGSTFLIGVGTTLIGGIGGMILGAVTGYFGGWLDEILMRVNDAAAAFPSVLLALVMISLWGSGTYKVMLALGIAFIPSFARIVRGEFMRLRETDYVISARLIGVKTPRILFVHILPNILPALLSALAIGFNNAVLAEAGMSYLGIGVQPPDASLGRMLSEAQTYYPARRGVRSFRECFWYCSYWAWDCSARGSWIGSEVEDNAAGREIVDPFRGSGRGTGSGARDLIFRAGW